VGDRVEVRRATADDAAAVIALIRALAEYEMRDGPDAEAEARLRAGLFADAARITTLIAEVDGAAAGYAVYFEHYSTFRGLPKLYLEDIFVLEQHRAFGLGFALFREVIRDALQRGCFQLEWQVLTWNRPALDFYERLGARHEDAWHTYYLDREGMERLAGS
jgi:GNAT superfamily N-acetyltransferase